MRAMELREARREDAQAIAMLTIGAFGESEFGHQGEAELVAAWSQHAGSLSVVALEGEQVVGHILFSEVELRSPTGTLRGMGLAPMSVLPERQRAGIGGALIRDGLARLDAPFCVVLGHPDYYPRFGFRKAGDYSLRHGFDGVPQEVFFVLERVEGALAPHRDGCVFYDVLFGEQHYDERSS